MRLRSPAAMRPPRLARLRLAFVPTLALFATLVTAAPSYALLGEPAFSMRIDGELFVWNGLSGQFASAYPSQTVYVPVPPLADSAVRGVTGCSGSIALDAQPSNLGIAARLQSDPGSGCVQSTAQGASEIKETLRFWASPERVGEPLRLDLVFELAGSHTYDVAGWPDARSKVRYGLDVYLYEVAQTYGDGSVEWGLLLGESLGRRSYGGSAPPHELVNSGALQLLPSDPSGEFGPGQRLTLRVTTERGAQIFLRWMLYAYVEFDNGRQGASGARTAIVEADLGSSLELISAVVRDPRNEFVVTDSGLAADSGFDYLALPEPTTALAQAAALFVLAGLRRLRGAG